MKVCPACGTEYGDEAAFCSRDRSPLGPQAPTSHSLLGRLIGERYQVDARLGEGGMGEVYLATHVLMGRRCALKVMSPALSKDPDAVSRFNREATNASRITHPNVCAVYDFGLTPEGLVYLAMEYIEGRTLTAVAKERGPMTVASAGALIAQCAAGLEAAHELGIVHRDLKPDNIMVLSRGGKDTVKLVDFGIAKAMEPEATPRVTRTGFVVGTPEYMSPEQLSGDPLDGRSDGYSLALVLYRLITGTLPFDGSSLQDTLVKRLTDPPRPLLISRPEGKFPAGLQAVMDRALARYPAERYPSVGAFVQDLAGVAAGAGEPTRRLVPLASGSERKIPATRPMTGAGAPRRSKAGLVAAGVAVAALTTWGVVQFSRTPGPVSAPPAAQARDSGGAVEATQASIPATPPPPAPVPPGPVTREVRPITTAVAPVPADTTSSPDTGLGSGGDTLALPDPEQFDSPARRAMALRRARQVLDGRLQPKWRRAMAAALLAGYAVQQGNRPEAIRLYSMANELNPKPSYETMIRQLRDSIPR